MAKNRIANKNKNKNSKSKRKENIYDVYKADNDQHEKGNFDEVENLEYDNQDIDIEDDEEIDEDEAFDSEDEKKYGDFFASKDNENDENDEDEEYSDNEDEEGFDLSEMLGSNNTNNKVSSIKKTEDELLPAENEDFEELEGEMSDLESEEEENENEDQGNDEKLVSFIDSLDTNKRRNYNDDEKITKKRKKEIVTEAYDEFEYNLPPRIKEGKKLDIKDFVGALNDEVGFGNLKKQLVQLERPSNMVKKEVLTAPLSQREQDRLNREAAYEQTNKEVSKWTHLVKRNREADHIVFSADDGKSVTTNASLTTKFTPQNEFENEISKLMEEAGVTEKKEAKYEELELNKVSAEEIRERRKELQRMRNLLFYQEQKMKKAAKIKSKAYHRILKKERQKKQSEMSIEDLQDLDPELASEERLKLETERARERMTLRHKNTGKWARRMLQRGNDSNAETRQAIVDQLNQHENLKRKIQDAEDNSDESDNILSDNEESIKEKALEQLDKMENDVDNENKPHKGIFAMKFMQKAFEKQRSEAKQNIIEMKKDIENDKYNDNSDSDIENEEKKENPVNTINVGRMIFSKDNNKEKEYEDSSEQTKKSIISKTGQIDQVSMSASHKLSVSGPININLKENEEMKPIFDVESFSVEDTYDGTDYVNKTKINETDDETVKNKKEKTNEINNETKKETKENINIINEKKNSNAKTVSKKNIEEVEEENDNFNPWLESENSGLIQSRKKQVSLDSNSNKQQKALEKLNQVKKNANSEKSISTEIDYTQIEELEHIYSQKQNQNAKLSIAQNEDSDQQDKKQIKSKNIIDEERKRKEEESKSETIEKIVENIAIDNHEIEMSEDNFKSISRNELLQMAFSENDVFEEEFENEKQKLIDDENSPEVKEALPGWGSWAGKGIKKKKKIIKKETKPTNVNKRKDAKLKNVIINERRIKKSVKLMVDEVPFPFENREQYEKSLRAPVGKEWTTVNTHKESIRPRILTKPGKIIHPLKFTKQFSDKKPEKKRATKSRL